MKQFSVIILTFNEEENIRRCLDSITDFTDDIILIDSFSTDATLKICEKYGCRVFEHAFTNQAVQFNWALDNVPWERPWTLRLDADEVLPDKLKQELRELTATCGPEVTGIYLNRRMYFMNRWLRHGGMYPHYILRAFRKGAGRYEEKTEEHFVLTSRQNTLKYWLKKHDDLSDGEIRDTLLESHNPGLDLTEDLFGNKVERTRWLKTRVYAESPLFLRAFLYFIYRYFLRLGFLDGIPGLIFHVLQAFWYRFYIDARIYETRLNWQSTSRDYRNL